MDAHFLKGQLLLQQKRYDQAAAELRLALAETPNDSDVHATLAIALLRMNRWQEALEAAQMAVSKSPDSSHVHWVISLVWLERSQLKEAEDSIRRAITIYPEDANNHGVLARVLLERERPEEALAAADAGLSLDPKDDLSLTYRARALMALGREAEARTVADTLLSEDPDDVWNHCLRGDQLVAEDRAGEARTHYLEALRLDPGMEYARQGLATTLKSRNPLYGALLKILLSASRLRTWSLWAAVILVFLALRFGDGWAARHPEWMLAYEIVKALLWTLVVLLVIANPLFDVLLRFDRDGRHALSEDELKATNWYLACFTLAALCALWAISANASYMPRRIGFGFLFLTQGVTQTFQSTAGYVRSWMMVAIRASAVLLILSPVLGFIGVLGLLADSHAPASMRLIKTSIFMPTAAILICAFSDNLREWLEKRRPDGR